MRVGSGGSPCRIARIDADLAGLRHDVEQRLRVGVARPEQHLLGRADLDDAAEVHHGHPVGDRPGEAKVVRHDQDRDPQLVAELHQQGEDLAAHRRVEVRHGLVGDDDLRLEHEGPRDHDALALAAGELVREEQVEALGGPQPRARQRLRDEILLGLAVRALIDLVDPQALGDDLVDRLARVQRRRRVLEHHLDLAPERAEAPAVRRQAPCPGTGSRRAGAGSDRRSHARSWSCRSRTRRRARAPRLRAA